MVEVHHEPEKALSDGQQALFPTQFAQLVSEILPILTEKQKARLLEDRKDQASNS
jgi:3-deoxy-D-arabino-heptulosonate 7-phosphate (DAHP) synthase